MNDLKPTPVASVIILNYNGAKWIARCLESLQQQTIFPEIEIIVADNQSSDGSDLQAEQLIANWKNGRFIQHGANLGYCEGNNRAALTATGEFLLFLNNDAWLEPDCLEILLRETKAASAQAATPLVLNYDDDTFQSLGIIGYDIFGLGSTRHQHTDTRDVLMPEGCSYLIDRQWFERLGRFDSVLFMYSDELDLSWRVWVAGGRAVAVPAARLHHRGAVNVNPAGGGTISEFRTSDTKRFYANRNGLLVILKNTQHVLLLLAVFQVLLLLLEAVVGLILIRRWSFIKHAYFGALKDCWRLRSHVAAERKRLAPMRRRTDWWMLRFLSPHFNRWDEIQRMRQLGLPKVSAK